MQALIGFVASAFIAAAGPAPGASQDLGAVSAFSATLGDITNHSASVEVEQQGAITGRVVERRTQRPIASAQVFIDGTGIGTLTNSAGRYMLLNVPAGSVVIRVQLIGYSEEERIVQIVSGETVTVNFEITEQALALDQIVVTGTPGGTQRRAIGNVVDRVDAGTILERSPATNISQMLSTRAAGMTVRPQPGMVGSGTSVRIRGLSSLSLGHMPLIYVDGVRMDNNASAGPAIRQGRQVSRLDDINLEDIESIEVIKGPAAATLYGTEASAGVIQIITKKGAQGAPTLDFTIRQGANWMPNPADRFFKTYYHNPGTGVTDSINLYRREADAGNPIFTTGHMQSYTGSIRGGTDLVRYYVSADVDDHEGIVDYNWYKKFSTRANVALVPSETWDMNVNLGFVRSNTRFAQAATGFDIWGAIVWGRPDSNLLEGPTRGFRYVSPEAAGVVDSRSALGRFTGGLQLNHRPTSWLHHRATLGLDYGTDLASQLFPRVPDGEYNYFGSQGAGQKIVENFNNLFVTFDYGATVTKDLTPAINSATSIGVQYYSRENRVNRSQGNVFPSPAVTTVGGAAVTSGSESYVANKTLGTYIQQQINWRDRTFFTAALRGDDNSAFGADFEAALYPKLSAAWVISEEPFFNLDWIGQLRLRSAWGQAGMQPGTFDAITLYMPITGPDDASVITPRTLGNPDLKPEVGEELELGFDAGLLQDRVSVTFTYFDKTTKDALVARRVRPSAGFPGTQMVNLGKIKSWGTETTLNGAVLERSGLGLHLGVTFATHRNRIDDMGDVEPQAGEGQRHYVGYPIASLFARRVVSAEFVGSTTSITNVMCDGGTGPTGRDQGGTPMPCADAPAVFWGQPEPTWSGNVSSTLRLGRSTRLFAMAEFRGGHHQISGDINGGHTSFTNTFATNPRTDPILQAYFTQVNREPSGLYDAGFARLRELSLSYDLPESFVSSFGSSRASITAAWRNVGFLWRAQTEVAGSIIFDPETNTPGDGTAMRHQTTMPPTSQFITTLRITF